MRSRWVQRDRAGTMETRFLSPFSKGGPGPVRHSPGTSAKGAKLPRRGDVVKRKILKEKLGSNGPAPVVHPELSRPALAGQEVSSPPDSAHPFVGVVGHEYRVVLHRSADNEQIPFVDS